MGLMKKRQRTIDGELPICVYTSGRNCQRYVEQSLRSVLDQQYSNYRHIIVDDCSSDATADCVSKAIGDSPKHTFIRGEKRRFWSGNAYEFLKPNDDEIVVTLDLDDWFAHHQVLQRVNEFHQMHDCWLTYGSYQHASDGQPDTICRPFPRSVLWKRSFRKHKWVSSHLRSFRGFLWNAMDHDEAMRGEDGEYATTAYDVGIMLPMLEMCPRGKILYRKDILMVYNDLNPLQDHKVSRERQVAVEQWFRSRPKVPVLQR